MTANLDLDTFSLDFFEGPLHFLLHLIQKSEIQICDVPIHDLTTQFLQKLDEMRNIDAGAEFIGTTAFLIWMKSKRLIPKHEQSETDEEWDPNFDIIFKLLEYCRIKDAAKFIRERHEQQAQVVTRGIHPLPEVEKKYGIEHLSLEDVAKLFRQALERTPNPRGLIQEENWRVCDKIDSIRDQIKQEKRISINTLFNMDRPRGELIVTFLAILELMKIGEIGVGKELTTGHIVLFEMEEG